MKEIKQFIETDEPVGAIAINGQEYPVFSPDNLEEQYYITYFYARAKSLDIVKKYTREVADNDGRIRYLPTDNPADTVRLELEMLEPAKEMITSLLQTDISNLNLKPKTVVAIYEELERLLAEQDMPIEDADGITEEGAEEEGKVQKRKTTKAKSTV